MKTMADEVNNDNAENVIEYTFHITLRIPILRSEKCNGLLCDSSHLHIIENRPFAKHGSCLLIIAKRYQT